MNLFEYLNFYGCLYDCPYRSRLPDCPVNPIDNKTFGEKYEWFQSLTKQEKDSIVKQHEQCSAKRDPSYRAGRETGPEKKSKEAKRRTC
jgi:hypothetical protein